MVSILSAIFSKYWKEIAAFGAIIASAVSLYMKGKSDQKVRDEVKNARVDRDKAEQIIKIGERNAVIKDENRKTADKILNFPGSGFVD